MGIGTAGGDAGIGSHSVLGRYRFYDDGWTGTLKLSGGSGQELEGQFTSDRYRKTYAVAGTIGAGSPNRIVLTIADYNEMKSQEYEGHVFSGTRKAFAGFTTWKDARFGFFAVKSVRLGLSSYRAGAVEVQDFAGSFSLYLDGQPGTLTLAAPPETTNMLDGSFKFRSAAAVHPVRAEVSSSVPYQVRISIDGLRGGGTRGDEILVLTGYLFTRPKNAVAGTFVRDGVSASFFMFRYQ
jgi:hypothetical protein